MSRAELRAALDAAGVTGHESMPNTPTAGQGWPEWVRTTYTETAGQCVPAETEWTVWVVLPAYGFTTAADVARDRIAQALHDVAAVDQSDPALIAVTEGGGNTLPALRYTVRTTP